MCDLRYTPSMRPSASRMAMELKYAGPARSKKLMGKTTPSSRATGAKCRTAWFSASGRASARWRESCSMQKYGVSNSSGSTITCAPAPAALRTSCSARAMFAAASQSIAICTAATMTGRAGRWKCSGARDMSSALGKRLMDLLRDARGGLECHETRLAGDHRRPTVADAPEKRLDLRLEGITGLEALLLDADGQGSGSLLGRALADHGEDLLLQVQRQVRVVLEDAQLALGLHADARGRRVGHAAVGETDAGVGDIDFVRKHRGPDRIDRGYRRRDDGLHDVDVVDHEIKHHVHIRAALTVRRQPVTFDEARGLQVGLGGEDRGVEALEVPDLQDPPRALRDADEFLRLRRRLGDRLLDQYVGARPQEVAGNRKVRRGRRDHAHRVDLAEQLAVVGERAHLELCRHLFARLGPLVHHGQKL